MADIVTLWDPASGTGDWSISAASQSLWTDEHGNSITDGQGVPLDAQFTPGQGLAADADLYTALLISIFTDAQAGPDDTITDGSDDPRGWWGGPIGSKLWLRVRSKQTDLTLALVKADLEEATRWLIEDHVASAIDVTTEWTRPGLLGARVVVTRNDGTRRALGFPLYWENV